MDEKLRLMSVQTLKEKIENIEVCMFTTLDQSGMIVSRPMATRQMDPDGTLWFFTNEYSEKVDDVEMFENINLAYSDVGEQTYVSIAGSAELVTDRNRMEQLWSPMLKAWFPKGLDDPRLGLIKVIPHTAEYWNATSSKMEQIFKMAKAIMKGKQYESGEHGKVNL